MGYYNYIDKTDNTSCNLIDYIESSNNRVSCTDQWTNYKIKGSTDLSRYAKYDSTVHKRNPLDKFKNYFRPYNLDSKVIAKGFCPILTERIKFNPGNYIIHYYYDTDNLGFITESKLRYKKSDASSWTQINCPPVIVFQGVGGGGAGATCSVAVVVYNPGAGGGSGGYFDCVLDLTFNNRLEKKKWVNIMNITVGAGGEQPGTNAGNEGGDGNTSSVIINYGESKPSFYGYGGGKGHLDSGGSEGRATIINGDYDFIWLKNSVNGQSGSDSGDTSRSISYDKKLCSGVNDVLSKITENHSVYGGQLGGCSVLGTGGKGSDGHRGVGSGYGSGGAGGIAWFWPQEGRNGAKGQDGLVRLFW